MNCRTVSIRSFLLVVLIAIVPCASIHDPSTPFGAEEIGGADGPPVVQPARAAAAIAARPV